MQYLPIKTRILHPPQDDLLSVLDEGLVDLKEGDVVVVSSKIVAIDEGRCVSGKDFDLAKHLQREADVIIPRPNHTSPLTIINNVIIGQAGVDKSNSDGYLTLLPENPFASAEKIYNHIKNISGLNKLGVIIADSRSEPCRYGATGVAIAFWGFRPLQNHIGKKDLFGREMKFGRSNVVDGITAGATVVMGEVAECTPLLIVREVPGLEFVDGNFKDELFCSPTDDDFKVLYERFLS